MKYTGLLEAIDLIENSGTQDSLRMAVSKIKGEQEVLEQLTAQLATAKKENIEWQEQIADHCIEIAELQAQLATAKEEKEWLRVALRQIQAEARSNVKCRPIVHDIAQRALKGEQP